VAEDRVDAPRARTIDRKPKCRLTFHAAEGSFDGAKSLSPASRKPIGSGDALARGGPRNGPDHSPQIGEDHRAGSIGSWLAPAAMHDAGNAAGSAPFAAVAIVTFLD